MTRVPFTPAQKPRDRFGLDTTFAIKLLFWLFAVITLLALALKMIAWHKDIDVQGPFEPLGSAPRSFVLAVPQDIANQWWGASLGDDVDHLYQSSVGLRINGREMGPAHAPHSMVMEANTAAFSHWGTNLLFSLPPGVTNGPETVATIRFRLAPPAPASWAVWALTFTTSLLAWCLYGGIVRSYSNRLDGLLGGYRSSASPAAKWTSLLLFWVFLALLFRLRQRDLEFVVESDFNWPMIEAFRRSFWSFNLESLPKPVPYVYLDGQFIVYSVFDGLLRLISGKVAGLQVYFPNDLSYALGGALQADILAYAAACTIFFAAMYRLTGYVSISVLLAAGFFLAPQMISINIARVDYLNTLPVMIIFYCSCVLSTGYQRVRHAIALGLALAFAATIKINGLVFGVFPAAAALAAFRFSAAKRLTLFAAISLAAFLPAYGFLMMRYFYHLSAAEIVAYYIDTAAVVKQWASFMGGPPTYYNIELMKGHGTAFIALYLACAAATLVIAVWHRSGPAIFLTVCFVVFSASGAVSLKYSHSGYHLLPVFFAQIGFIAAALLNSGISPYLKATTIATGAAVIALSLVNSFEVYANTVARRKMDVAGLQTLKREPRDWLHSNIPPATTICIQTASEWTLPPLDGFSVSYAPLAISYLDAAALAKSIPPSPVDVEKSCPVIITSDLHRSMYDHAVRLTSPVAADRWVSFFAALKERYPTITFSNNFGVNAKRITINDLREK